MLAGTSNLYHLRTTAGSQPLITGSYQGPLYSADMRAAATRPYRCAGCGAVHQVGPGAPWAMIAELKAAGLPGLRRDRAEAPGAVRRAGPGGGPPVTDGAAGFRVRPAREEDLDAIAGFEIEIARESFGDEAIEDAALHRKRVATALGRPGEVTLVAVAAGGDGPPVGWAWLSGRTNSLTGDRYGNFRSLAAADIPGRSEVGELL